MELLGQLSLASRPSPHGLLSSSHAAACLSKLITALPAEVYDNAHAPALLLRYGRAPVSLSCMLQELMQTQSQVVPA